ncbi:MAG TPA: DUF1801 domain-containing protein [Vicinamibacterales bacterium]|nr:DUF1801 domain-containing protein [Vicinamibacterales bacterium]
MAELKTKATKASVTQFINGIKDEGRRQDCKALVAMMTKATNAQPVMWGNAIVGFGDHEYTGANGKAVKWFKVGFSPRKAALSLYLLGGKNEKLLAKLGPSAMGAGCLYIKRLEDVDAPTLQKLIGDSVKRLRALPKKR